MLFTGSMNLPFRREQESALRPWGLIGASKAAAPGWIASANELARLRSLSTSLRGGKRADEVIRLGAEERRALRKRHLFESRRLPGCRQNGLPPKAIGINLLLLKDQHLNRDMDKCVMQKSDN